MSDAPAPLPEAARAALARGRTIEAIKIVREVEGIGLKEAKARVDAFDGDSPTVTDAPSPAAPSPAVPGVAALPAAAQAALARGEVIAAIRIVREVEGVGLKAAKARVDAHHGRRGGLPVGHAGAPERRGAGVWVLVLLALLLAGWWLTR